MPMCVCPKHSTSPRASSIMFSPCTAAPFVATDAALLRPRNHLPSGTRTLPPIMRIWRKSRAAAAHAAESCIVSLVMLFDREHSSISARARDFSSMKRRERGGNRKASILRIGRSLRHLREKCPCIPEMHVFSIIILVADMTRYVIEHLTDPFSFVQDCAALLSPNGILTLTTPRFDSLPARLLGKHWHCVFPAHLHYFTRASMEAALSKAGLRLIDLRQHVRYFSPAYFAQRLLKSQISTGLIRSRTFPVTIGDEMEVYARKIS
jgi:hypothetical protein